MAVTLPAAGYISDNTRTKGEVKAALEEFRDAIAEVDTNTDALTVTVSGFQASIDANTTAVALAMTKTQNLNDVSDKALSRTNLDVYSKSESNALAIEATTKMYFYQVSAPTGWTIDNTITDKVIAVKGGSDAYNVAGGSVAGTWTQPTHTHDSTVPLHNHMWNQAYSGGTTEDHSFNSDGLYPPNTAYTGAVRNDISFGISLTVPTNTETRLNTDEYTDNEAAQILTSTGSGTVNTWRPSAAVGIICTKD